MQTYNDNDGTEWKVELNAWTLKRVRDNSGVLLTSLLEDGAAVYSSLYSDPILLADIVWPLIEDQAKERGVTLKDFAIGFSGDTVGNARDAVVEATVDFFDDPETRDRAREAIAMIQRIAATMRTAATEKVEAMDVDSAARKYIDASLS